MTRKQSRVTGRHWLVVALMLSWFLPYAVPMHAASLEPMPLKGDFSLVDETGRKVSLADYRGSMLLVYFGYTYCPDVCPTNLGIIAQALDMLPKAVTDNIQPLLITVDPGRDLLVHLKEYTKAFHSSMMGLSGSEQAIAQAAKLFGVYYAKVETDPEEPDSYLMDHSASTYFLNEQGEIVDIFDHALPAEQMVERILKWVNR
ncbi:MAG: SCO family protein [Magnetococcales bacterium]|nr:SCO family protein [Magnetococcales bacterium]